MMFRYSGEYGEHIQISHSGAGEQLIISDSVYHTTDHPQRTSQTAAEAEGSSSIIDVRRRFDV